MGIVFDNNFKPLTVVMKQHIYAVQKEKNLSTLSLDQLKSYFAANRRIFQLSVAKNRTNL